MCVKHNFQLLVYNNNKKKQKKNKATKTRKNKEKQTKNISPPVDTEFSADDVFLTQWLL